MTFATFGFVILLISLIYQAILLFRHKLGRKSLALINSLSAALFLVEMLIRSIKVNYVALLGTYDSLIFYAAFILILLVIYDLQQRFPPVPAVRFGLTVLSLAFIALASSPLIDSGIRPPIPALRSGWLIIHVALAFIGESFFAFSFVTALISLLTRNREIRHRHERLTYLGIILGYPIFTLGALIFGAVWAENAWGRWWSWDPKETWALITWLVYTLFLHLRFLKKAGGRTLALVSVIGFLSTLFTFFGVNYLLSSLHSYG